MTAQSRTQLDSTLWKIADELRGAVNADDLINAENKKIEALMLYKKGLLQGLFPTMITNNN